MDARGPHSEHQAEVGVAAARVAADGPGLVPLHGDRHLGLETCRATALEIAVGHNTVGDGQTEGGRGGGIAVDDELGRGRVGPESRTAELERANGVGAVVEGDAVVGRGICDDKVIPDSRECFPDPVCGVVPVGAGLARINGAGGLGCGPKGEPECGEGGAQEFRLWCAHEVFGFAVFHGYPDTMPIHRGYVLCGG